VESDLLQWDSQASTSGDGTRYDVMSGDLSEVATSPGELCLATGLAATEIADLTAAPLPGAGRFYLVRAANTCGRSRWETASDGRDRQTEVCAP
jgi:hypothetical protein